MRFPYKIKDTRSIQRNFDYLTGFLTRNLHSAPVSVMPTDPHDGQVVIFQNAGMLGQNVVWVFRYNAAGGIYKWQFIGGTPFAKAEYGAVAYTTGAGAYVWGPALTAPQIVVPMTGVYGVRAHMAGQSANSTSDLRMGLFVNGVQYSGLGGVGSISAGVPMYNANPNLHMPAMSLTGGWAMDLRLASSVASYGFSIYDRAMELYPSAVA